MVGELFLWEEGIGLALPLQPAVSASLSSSRGIAKCGGGWVRELSCFPFQEPPVPSVAALLMSGWDPYYVGTESYLNQEVLNPMCIPHPSPPQGILKDGFPRFPRPRLFWYHYRAVRDVIGKKAFI